MIVVIGLHLEATSPNDPTERVIRTIHGVTGVELTTNGEEIRLQIQRPREPEVDAEYIEFSTREFLDGTYFVHIGDFK